MAVQENGEKLIMMDGTIWVVEPENAEMTKSWIPPCPIEIDNNVNNREFDYILKHPESGISINAKKRR
jgi:hypothetical protein